MTSSLDGMFELAAREQKHLPHLLEHLWASYSIFLATSVTARVQRREPTLTYEDALARAPATSFLAWATAYLRRNRVIGTFPLASGSFGARLSTGACFLLTPPVAGEELAPGATLPSTSVAVTGDADDEAPAWPDGSVPII